LGHYLHTIEATKGHQKFTVKRRYTEIEHLHNLFQMQFPGSIIPPIPVKDQEDLTERKSQIEEFLRECNEHGLLS